MGKTVDVFKVVMAKSKLYLCTMYCSIRQAKLMAITELLTDTSTKKNIECTERKKNRNTFLRKRKCLGSSTCGTIGLGEHPLDRVLCITQPGTQGLWATVSFDPVEAKSAETAILIDEGYGLHAWAQNQFRVIGEEVNLENAVGQLQNNGTARSEPSVEHRQARVFIALWDLSCTCL